ncbi:MAG: PQQ-binding-like beta-propeller repeat protein [Bdellovibrionales bacterium]
MEYESRQVKWYWLLLFIVYCGAVVYVLFKGNPYLYSHHELRAELMSADETRRLPIPAKPVPVEKPGAVTTLDRFNFERTAVDNLGATRNKNYVEFENHIVEHGLEELPTENISQDETGFFLSGRSPWAVKIGLDGSAIWKFRFHTLDSESSLLPIQADEATAYLVHPKGEVVALDKMTGAIRWILPLKQEVAANPFIWARDLVIPVKGEKNILLVLINRTDGSVKTRKPKLDLKPGFLVSYGKSLDALLAAVDNKVVALDPDEWSALWSQTLTDPVKGPAVIVDNQIYVSTLGARLIKLDGSKKGKLEWEVELEYPAAAAPTYLPTVGRLSFLNTEGALVTLDAKTGKPVWHHNVENKNPLVETWSARLKGQHIEEFGMDWLHKGWTIWSPCSSHRFCIYTPNKGQLIERVQLSGAPMTLPILQERRWVFFTRVKEGQYGVSHVLEEGEVKKIRSTTQAADTGAGQNP